MTERPMPGASAIHVLVAACDAHGDNTSQSSSPPETSRSTTSETVARHKPRSNSTTSQPRGVNVSRDRMKQEIYRLRDTVEELQRQLDEIKRDHVRRSPRPAGPIAPSTVELVAAWEAMARGQCEQRYRAEVENVKLRKMLDEQVKIAHTLERILTKRRSSEQLLAGQIVAKHPRTTSPAALDDPQVLDDLDAMLPSLYAQVDAVLGRDCFAQRNGTFRSVNVRHADETRTTYVEAMEKRLLPFTHDDVGDAMWEYYVFYPDQSSNDPAILDDLQRNVMVRETEVSVQLPRFTGHVRIKFTARRFVEKDRIVVVWVALADPSNISEAPLDDVHIRHTGWTCTRKSTLQVDDTAMTEYFSAQLSVPEFNDGASDRKRRLCTLTNYLVSSVNFHLDASKQTLDNRLLERSLARTASSGTHVQRSNERMISTGT